MTLPQQLAEIRERLEKATPLPYKQFPILFIQTDGEGNESKQAKVMNEYMQLGLDLLPQCARLLTALEKAIEQRNSYHCMTDQQFSLDDDNSELAAILEGKV